MREWWNALSEIEKGTNLTKLRARKSNKNPLQPRQTTTAKFEDTWGGVRSEREILFSSRER